MEETMQTYEPVNSYDLTIDEAIIDAVSPRVDITEIEGGHRITITDVDGAHTFDVMDGEGGSGGKSIEGCTLNADYTLTIEYTDGTSDTVGPIRGAAGEDGYSVRVLVNTISGDPGGHRLTIMDKYMDSIVDVMNGERGSQGERGPAGVDGISPTVDVTPITNGYHFVLTDAHGTSTFDLYNGTDGSDGKSIEGCTLNADYTLTIEYTDGTSDTVGPIRGATGPQGPAYTLTQADKADIVDAVLAEMIDAETTGI